MSTAKKLPTIIEQNDEAMAMEATAIDWKATAEAYEIASPEMAEAAAEDLRAIKKIQKSVEGLRKELKQPSIDEGREIDAFFKRPKDFLASAEKVLKGAILNFQAAEEAKRLEHANQNQAPDTRDDDDFEAPSAASLEPEAQKLDGISSRKTWKAEVTDKLALVKAVAAGDAPLAFLEVNQKHLDGMARSLGDEMKVPGVRPFEEKSLAVR